MSDLDSCAPAVIQPNTRRRKYSSKLSIGGRFGVGLPKNCPRSFELSNGRVSCESSNDYLQLDEQDGSSKYRSFSPGIGPLAMSTWAVN